MPLLGGILGAMLLGLAVLADRWHIGPRSGQTVLSQIIAAAIGRHWAYYVMSLAITVVFALAANTCFGGLPVLASLLARDTYLPRVFALRDDRQVFASGIGALAVLSGALIIAVGGNTLTLIPLYAIGVFTGFTLSQTGLAVHWRRTRPPRWQHQAIINGAGAITTAGASAQCVWPAGPRMDEGPGACWRRAPLSRCDLPVRPARRGRPSRPGRPGPGPRCAGTRRRARAPARSLR